MEEAGEEALCVRAFGGAYMALGISIRSVTIPLTLRVLPYTQEGSSYESINRGRLETEMVTTACFLRTRHCVIIGPCSIFKSLHSLTGFTWTDVLRCLSCIAARLDLICPSVKVR